MPKKILAISVTIMILAFAAGAAMAAKGDQNKPDPAVQATQPPPATEAPVQAAPDPVGPHHHGAAYYPGWTCGYYHPAGPQPAPAPGYSHPGWGWCCW